MNKVIICGNLGKDIELAQTQGGMAYARMSVATTKWSKKDNKTLPVWHIVVAWGKSAESVAKIAGKGSKVLITGEIVYGTYKNKQGVDVKTTDIHTNEFIDVVSQPQRNEQSQVDTNPVHDDIPF